MNQLLPEPHAGLLAGLMFGTKAALPRDFYDALVRSGTLHIIALSGMNISILGRMITNGLLWLVGKRIAGLFTLFLIVWFVWFVGPSASIVRAAIMGSISILAVLFGRQYWAVLSWILAVGIMLLLNFSWLFELSFQLSALATLGIILFGHEENIEQGRRAEPDGKRHYSILSVILGSMRDDLHLTLAAQVFTIPVILFHFHRMSLISPVSNLAIGWVIAPLTGLGWVTILVSFIAMPAARIIAWIDWVFLEYIVRTVYLTSSIPFASVGK
mgnify:CR=1 FL=1